MKHTMKSHPNNENLVYTDQSVLDAFTQEVDKYITKFKGYGIIFFSSPLKSVVKIKESCSQQIHIIVLI